MKKLLMGMVWFVVLFVGIWLVLGCIIAARTPAGDYSSSEAYEQACREAGARLGIEYGGYTIAFAALLAAMGTIAGVLPGTGGRVAIDELQSSSGVWQKKRPFRADPCNFRRGACTCLCRVWSLCQARWVFSVVQQRDDGALDFGDGRCGGAYLFGWIAVV